MAVAQTLKTQCPHGHPYDTANTYTNAKGHRYCRVCVNRGKKAYRARYPEPHRRGIQRWKREHPEKNREYRSLRRSRLRGVICEFTHEQWEAVVTLYGGRCAYCYRMDKPLTIDHVVPISQGGPHTAANIVPACLSCNSRKGVGSPAFRSPFLG